MSEAPSLLANIAGEEGPGWRELAREPRVRAIAAAWQDLFREPSPYAWLEGEAFAWINSPEAGLWARELGRTLFGADPEVVRSVHDKAFALEVALREGLLPTALAGHATVLEPGALGDAGALVERIEAELQGWPDWLAGDATLKPRFGSSGRGRVALAAGCIDLPTLRGALPRLVQRGGALLEPWLSRLGDYSTQLLIDADGGVILLGTLEQVVTDSGVLRGHRGTLDSRGRVTSGHAVDEALREASLCVALAAAEAGYRGPCGVDAFCFRGPDGEVLLHPVVEFNARFTAGTVALGFLRRELSTIRGRLGLEPGLLLSFYLALDAPPSGWPSGQGGKEWTLLPYAEAQGALRPGLLIARGPEPIDRALTPAPD